MREIPPEVREYNLLRNELSYPSSDKTITIENLLSDRYMDSLKTSVKNIKAKMDSLESLSSFNKLKEESEKSGSFLFNIGMSGAGVMVISLPFLWRGMRKQRKIKKGVN